MPAGNARGLRRGNDLALPVCVAVPAPHAAMRDRSHGVRADADVGHFITPLHKMIESGSHESP
jgi:hypothetical protein